MKRLLYYLVTLMTLASSAEAVTITLTEDTVIDGANSYPEPPAPDSLGLTLTDGPVGPPTVELRDGGVVGGFTFVRGGSHLDMSGGQIQALVNLFDDATFTLRGGTILPLVRFYDRVEVVSVLRVTDQATLNLRGGSFFGRIRAFSMLL
ncbi:MAG: hypothetical protein SH868_13440 [Bythopirellula sp.]|nr:hypothetical protein [Bythopirellula sp.]